MAEREVAADPTKEVGGRAQILGDETAKGPTNASTVAGRDGTYDGRPTSRPRRVLGLQRAVGNSATSEFVVQRRAPYTGKASELDDELRALITSRSKVLDLIRQMNPSEKRAVLGGMRSRMTSVLNFNQMKTAVQLLGADLPTALDWLQGASIMTIAISYSEIQPLITRAPRHERLALKTPRWQTFFRTVCNTRTMIEAVNDLGFDLVTKLEWIRSESSALFSLNFALLKPLLLPPTTGADRATVATAAWQPFWEDVCTNATMAELVDLLFPPSDLRSKIRWMVSEGTNWSLMKARIAGTPVTDRPTVYGDAPVRRAIIDTASAREIVEASQLLGGTLLQRLQLLADKDGWRAMRDGLAAMTPAERLALYADEPARQLLLRTCTAEQVVEAVRLLGGTLQQKMPLLLAKGVPANDMIAIITAAPEAERTALYNDTGFVAWIGALPDQQFANVLRLLQGTPAQQMTLFGATRPIALLTWPTPSQEWVDAIKAVRPNPLDMLAVAGANLAWAPFLRPRLAEWFRGRSETVVGADAVNLVWAAYGDGATFNSSETLVVFRAIYSVPLAPAGTDKIFPKGSNAAGNATRERYNVVAPSDAAARGFMKALRPIPRSQVAIAPIVFSDKYWDETQTGPSWAGPEKSLGTSFFWQGTTVIHAKPGGEMNMVIINRDALGDGTAFGGGSTVPTGMDPLTYFQNHVRHEVGHAVGERPIGTMTQSGNNFATAYAGWTASNQSSFLSAMWTPVAEPLTGWPRLDFGGGAVQVTDADVQAWLVGILATKAQVAGPIRTGTKTLRQKLAVISGSLWGTQTLVAYLNAIGGGNDPARIADGAYQFTGFTPGTPVHIYATRFGDQFATYSKAAFDALHTSTGWYSLSSPAETFAEVYTRKYSGAGVPTAVNGKDWTTFFTELERQEDPMFGAPPPAAPPSRGLAHHPGP
jgi:hypothetical protein